VCYIAPDEHNDDDRFPRSSIGPPRRLRRWWQWRKRSYRWQRWQRRRYPDRRRSRRRIGGECASLDGAWDQFLVETDFSCSESYLAYADLQACACDETSIGSGCGAICDGDKNGTGTPNFCNGVPALSQCAQCLSDVCGGQYDACLAN
jgi:hypothetical protein